MSEELLDVVTHDNKITGKHATKDEVHKHGLWHRSSHVWIYNSKHEVLLQQRGEHDHFFPSCWDVSVGGHVPVGEDPADTIRRELREELDLDAEAQFVCVYNASEKDDRRAWTNNEIIHIYFYEYNGSLDNLRFVDGETKAVKFFSLDEFERAINDPARYKEFVPHDTYYRFIIEKLKKV
jgi:isopentenyl-diphosphate Delta-isomerase